MDYIGEKVKRFVELRTDIEGKADAEVTKYLKSNNKLIEFLDTCKPKTRAYVLEAREEMFEDMTEIGKGYWQGAAMVRRSNSTKDHYAILSPYDKRDVVFYKELPIVFDEDDLVWRKNGNMYTAIITRGTFDYCCSVSEIGNGRIKVKYTEGDNYHRRSVTIAEINVINANNKAIREAIEEWKNNFMFKLSA